MASPAALTSPFHHGAFLLAASLFATGCGGAAAGAKGGEAAPPDASLDPASELDRAEREISSLFGPAPEPAGVAATADPYAKPPPPAQPPVTQAAPAEPQSGSANADEKPAADPCAIACRALASMERAASHLCRISTESDPACTNARERVKAANARVAARCACGG